MPNTIDGRRSRTPRRTRSTSETPPAEDAAPEPPITLGTRIRRLRVQQGLSQDALAAPRFTKSYISALERDKVRPSLKALSFIAARLGVPESSLLAGLSTSIDDPAVTLGRAEAAILAGRPEEAVAMLAEQPTTPTDVQRLLLLAQAHAALSNWREVADAARELLGFQPSTAVAAQAHDLLGLALAGLGHPYDALTEHKAAVAAVQAGDPQVSQVSNAVQADVLRHLPADYELLQIKDRPDRSLTQPRGDVSGILARRVREYAEESSAAYAAGRVDVAATRLAQARALDEVCREILLAAQVRMVGTAGRGASPDESAQDELREALTLAALAGGDGLAASILVRQADAALAAGNVQQAERHVERILDMDREQAGGARVRALLLRGRIAAGRGQAQDTDAALAAALDEATAQNNTMLQAEAARALADVLAQRGEHERATRYFRRALEAGRS